MPWKHCLCLTKETNVSKVPEATVSKIIFVRSHNQSQGLHGKIYNHGIVIVWITLWKQPYTHTHIHSWDLCSFKSLWRSLQKLNSARRADSRPVFAVFEQSLKWNHLSPQGKCVNLRENSTSQIHPLLYWLCVDLIVSTPQPLFGPITP